MSVTAFVILGGVAPAFFDVLPEGWDGPIDSVGLEGLAKQLGAIPGVNVITKDWGEYTKVLQTIPTLNVEEKVAIIGFSGGGSRSTWIANSNDGKGWPDIDLLIGYDPSPSWQMLPLHANVKKAICYYNSHPMMPSMVGPLGGGQFTAALKWGCETILTRHIAEQHLAVQFNPALHAATIQAVKDLIAA